MAIVVIERPQVAKTVAVVVNHPSGTALPDVTVEERSDDWKTVLRSTQTDERGRFHFSPGAKTVYYLEFSRSCFNWPRIKLQIQKKAKRLLTVAMPIGTYDGAGWITECKMPGYNSHAPVSPSLLTMRTCASRHMLCFSFSVCN
jgi:hypothetical protein